MVKVVCPHELPKKISDNIFAIGKEWELANDSFFIFTVGDFVNEKDHCENDKRLLRLDRWLIDNGCDVGEELLIKHWW